MAVASGSSPLVNIVVVASSRVLAEEGEMVSLFWPKGVKSRDIVHTESQYSTSGQQLPQAVIIVESNAIAFESKPGSPPEV